MPNSETTPSRAVLAVSNVSCNGLISELKRSVNSVFATANSCATVLYCGINSLSSAAAALAAANASVSEPLLASYAALLVS